MKRVLIATVLLILATLLSCTNPTTSDTQKEGLIIKGIISNGISKSINQATRDISSPSKVILFYNDSYIVESITDGKFEIPITKRQAAGLVLASSNNEFMGYTTFLNGPNTIPLNTINETDKVIDLGNIVITNKIAASSTDIFETLGIGLDRTNRIGMASKLFGEVVKNPDYDANGIIDILEGKRIRVSVIYYIQNNTSFGSGLTPSTPTTSMGIKSHKFIVSIKNPSISQSSNAILTTPNQTVLEKTGSYNSNVGSFYFPAQNGVPEIGKYSIVKDNSTYNYEINSDYFSENYIIIMIPTIVLNNDNITIKSISWKSYDNTMQEITTPLDVLTKIQVQIDVKNPIDYGITKVSNPNRVYDSPLLGINENDHILEKGDIKWNDVQFVFVTYYDAFGNNYVNQYGR